MPEMGMYMEEGVLTAWLRPEGARVEAGDSILEITTEKVTFEVPAPVAGILHRAAEVGTSLQVQGLLGYILAEGEAAPDVAEREVVTSHAGTNGTSNPHTPPQPIRSGSPKASPAARRLAKQHGIDLRLVKGSGPGGRIVEADILTRVSQEQT
jgi:pyruvate/2-oxoglutarate dehydrogenase complex dihydrolipoamide acyltransferase (E2) component